MRNQAAPGSMSYGLPWMIVYVEEVDLSNNSAIVIDQFGRRRTLRADYRRGKGMLPLQGERWIIDQTLGHWMFAAVIEDVRPEVTGKTRNNPAVKSLIDNLVTQGVVTDATTDILPIISGSRGGNQALESLLAALDAEGYIDDQTTP